MPEPSFAAVVSEVQHFGHATSVTTTSTDVTGQYVDLQARITALEASRQQYLTIMSQATSIGDILAVQSQLDTLQSQIEQLQGQLSVLDNETTYGSLTVSLAEAGHRPPPPPPTRTGLDEAWHTGIGGFVSGVEWLIRIAGTTLFVLLCPGCAGCRRPMGVAGVPPPDALRPDGPPPDALRPGPPRTGRSPGDAQWGSPALVASGTSTRRPVVTS